MHGAFSLTGVPHGLSMVERVVCHALVIVKEGRVKIWTVLLKGDAIVHGERANDTWCGGEHSSGFHHLDLGCI